MVDLSCSDVLEDWCCFYHFSDLLVPNHVSSGLVHSPSAEAFHLSSCQLPLKGFAQHPCLALEGQCWREDCVAQRLKIRHQIAFRLCFHCFLSTA